MGRSRHRAGLRARVRYSKGRRRSLTNDVAFTERRKDTASDVSHQLAYEGNKRLHRSGPSPVNVIGVSSNEDRRNGVSDFNEMSVEFDFGHRRHMDVVGVIHDK